MSLRKTLLALEGATIEVSENDELVKSDYVEDNESGELQVTLESLAKQCTKFSVLHDVFVHTNGGQTTTAMESLLLTQVVTLSTEDDSVSGTDEPKESNFVVRGLKAIWKAITGSISWLFGKIASFFRWMFGIQKKVEDKVESGLSKVDALPATTPVPSGKPSVSISNRLSISGSPSNDLASLQKNLQSLNTLTSWVESHYTKIVESLYRELVRFAESKDTDNVRFLELVYEKALATPAFKPVFKHSEGDDHTTDNIVGDVVGKVTWVNGKLKAVTLDTPVEKPDEVKDVQFELPNLAGVKTLYTLAKSHSDACKPLQRIQDDFKGKVEKVRKIFEKRFGFNSDTGEFKPSFDGGDEKTKLDLLLRAFHLLVAMSSTPTMPLAKLHLGVALRLTQLADECIAGYKED